MFVQAAVAESLLNLLTGELFYRLELKNIQLDANGIALVPERFQFVHSKDRKFIAIAIQCKPYAPIYNATDTDWTKEREQLEAAGIFVEELCPDYISAARGGGLEGASAHCPSQPCRQPMLQ